MRRSEAEQTGKCTVIKTNQNEDCNNEIIDYTLIKMIDNFIVFFKIVTCYLICN